VVLNNGDIFTGNDTNEDYEVLKRLGSGGFGDTYLVGRMSDGEEFVAKIPNKTDQRIIQCLINEFNVLKTLEAKGVPHVVRAVEMSSFKDSFGTDHVILIMEKAELNTLENVIRQGVLSFDDTLEIISKCAEGLKGIHDAGFIHRDIAPDNIIVDDVGGQNIVTIIDLGIAAAKAEKDTHVLVSMIAHKVFYSPPEQSLEQKVSIGNDIYSLGATAVSMLVGFDPQISRHVGPLDLHNYLTGMDEHFRQVIMKATWDTRAGRFATMQDMYDALGGKIPDESMPRIIADGKTILLQGDGPWIIGRGIDDVSYPPGFVPINETSTSGTYIGRKHACIERRSDGVLMLYDGNREDGTPSKNGTKVLHKRWMDVPALGFPLGKKFIEIALGYSNNPPPIKDKDGNVLQPGPYKTIEFWPPQTSGTILPP
jgi:serine/threonine protein kinase